MRLRIATVGFGKIAHDQHLPAVSATPLIELAAIASPAAQFGEVPSFETLEALLVSDVGFDAVAICTPPQIRHSLATVALARGKQCAA